MTGPPPIHADPPQEDLLSELLRTVRLTGSVFLDGRFTAPFGVISPQRWDENETVSRLRHISVFHLIASGNCTLQTANGRQVALTSGDVLLMPFTAEHRFWCGDPERFAFAPDIVGPGPFPGVGVISHGGGEGEAMRVVCGFIESAELLPAPLFRTLPDLIIEPTAGVAGPIGATAQAVFGVLKEAPSPGAQAILGRLMEVLFVEVLRRHAGRLPEDAKGVLAASRDPIVSRALSRLHADPARRWTVEDLAADVGASRTVLGERFGRLVGAAPIEYLAGIRMQKAAERLRSTRDPLSSIALEVGYESEAAFSRAFRRLMGTSPGAWRAAA